MRTINTFVNGQSRVLSFDEPLTQVTKKNVKSVEGSVYSISVTNGNTSPRYLQIHDKSTNPSASDVPILSMIIPGGSSSNPTFLSLTQEDFGNAGLFCENGIGWAISTTFSSFTDSATASDHIVSINYY